MAWWWNCPEIVRSADAASAAIGITDSSRPRPASGVPAAASRLPDHIGFSCARARKLAAPGSWLCAPAIIACDPSILLARVSTTNCPAACKKQGRSEAALLQVDRVLRCLLSRERTSSANGCRPGAYPAGRLRKVARRRPAGPDWRFAPLSSSWTRPEFERWPPKPTRARAPRQQA